VQTDSFPPLAKFAAPFGIIELRGDGAVPVTLRNLEPKVKARRLEPTEPVKVTETKPVEKKETLVDKAKVAWDRIASRISGDKKKEKGATVAVKTRIISPDKEETIIRWLRTVRDARRNRPLLGKGEGEEFVIEKPGGAKAFEVVGIPLRKAGFHVIQLESPVLGAALLDKARPMYVSSAALVTNMSVHLKSGRESSIVWVTSLDKGEPVAGAQVHVRDCNGRLLWQGKTDNEGIARVGDRIPDKLPYYSEKKKSGVEEDDYYDDNRQEMLQGMDGGLFVFARKGDDLSFVHSSWDKGIESWRFNLPYEEFREHTLAHTVFDRTLVRAGETVHMKHFMRNHTMKGFGLRKVADLPKGVVIQHRGSGQRYEYPLTWKGDNTALTEMTVPRGAALGFYDVFLTKEPPIKVKGGGAEENNDSSYVDGWESGFFRVEEFRVPLMKGMVEPPKEPAVNVSAVDLDLFVSHLAGGGAGGEKVKLRTQVKPRGVSFDDYED
jgi:uncharacterized protein YfaS (alpha-2-macroglobulin family)